MYFHDYRAIKAHADHRYQPINQSRRQRSRRPAIGRKESIPVKRARRKHPPAGSRAA